MKLPRLRQLRGWAGPNPRHLVVFKHKVTWQDHVGSSVKGNPTVVECGDLGIILSRMDQSSGSLKGLYRVIVGGRMEQLFCAASDFEFVDLVEAYFVPDFKVEKPDRIAKEYIRKATDELLALKSKEAIEEICKQEDKNAFNTLEAACAPSCSDFKYNGQTYWIRFDGFSTGNVQLRLFKKCGCCGEVKSVHVEAVFKNGGTK